jgi:uncharacterized membrane protein
MYPVIVRVAVVLVLGVTILPFAPQIIAAARHYGFHPHPPDLSRWGRQPVQIQLHVAAAITAFGIGSVILLRPKGVGLHKALGWSWVIAMGATAISSFFITSFTSRFSPIHLISGWTVVALPMALFAIRRGNVQAHRRAMTGLFVGGLLLAGLLTFIPGRLMYMLFFG